MLPAAKLVNEVCASSKGPHLYVSTAILPSGNSTALKQGFVEEVLMASIVVSGTNTVIEAHCLDDAFVSVSIVGEGGMLVTCFWKLGNIELVEVTGSVPLVAEKAVNPSGEASSAPSLPFIVCEGVAAAGCAG